MFYLLEKVTGPRPIHIRPPLQNHHSASNFDGGSSAPGILVIENSGQIRSLILYIDVCVFV